MKKILALNLKMNFNYQEVTDYVQDLKGEIKSKNVIFFPPTIFLPYFIGNECLFGTQNISEFDNGAHTGEVSCTQLKSIGGTYTIIGHSERRKDQKEEDAVLNLRIKKALENGLKVIYCIGETKEERDMLKTTKILKSEILNGLAGIKPTDLKNVIIAYEPIWSIGTGVTPTSKEIASTTAFIIDTAVNTLNYKPRVLYGGSVNDKNIAELNKIANVSGFLVGGASLDVKKVLKMKEAIEK